MRTEESHEILLESHVILQESHEIQVESHKIQVESQEIQRENLVIPKISLIIKPNTVNHLLVAVEGCIKRWVVVLVGGDGDDGWCLIVRENLQNQLESKHLNTNPSDKILKTDPQLLSLIPHYLSTDSADNARNLCASAEVAVQFCFFDIKPYLLITKAWNEHEEIFSTASSCRYGAMSELL
ncbi:hypothetical protein Tco_0664639 [Tanacetum coccineum]